MLKSVILFIYLLEFGNVIIDAATAYIPPQKKPEKFAYDIGCYLNDYDKVVSFNQSVYPKDGKSCVKYTCEFDGFVSRDTCGKEAFEGNCNYVAGNKTLDYPDCCDRYDCSSGKSKPNVTKSHENGSGKQAVDNEQPMNANITETKEKTSEETASVDGSKIPVEEGNDKNENEAESYESADKLPVDISPENTDASSISSAETENADETRPEVNVDYDKGQSENSAEYDEEEYYEEEGI